jgi:phosphatidylserine decarboxylase
MENSNFKDDNESDRFHRTEKPSPTAFPVASAGYPIIFAAAFVTAVLALLELTVPAMLALTATIFICFFFRDPDRLIPKRNGAVVSPADGKVIVAETVESNPFIEGPAQKVSVFMSVFNVHVNRIPYQGVIKKISYYPGKFFAANREKASRWNEHNALVFENERGQTFCTVQIAGLVARRIICYVQEGDCLERGQRFGLICFGSRLDVYLPAETTLSVTVGDRVKAGTSILGYLP